MALSIPLPLMVSLHTQLIHQACRLWTVSSDCSDSQDQPWGGTEVGVSSSVIGLHHFCVAHVMGAIIISLLKFYSDPNQIPLKTTERCATHRLYETLRVFLSRFRVVKEPMITAGKVAPRVSAFWPIREVNVVLLPGKLFHPRWKC